MLNLFYICAMALTPDSIIEIVCEALKLDRESLLVENKQGNQNYRDGRLIAVYLIRNRITETKLICGTTADNKRAKMEVDKPIPYKEIAYIFKRKKPQTAMYSEIACKEMLTNKSFKAKYDMVVNLLDGNTNIA